MKRFLVRYIGAIALGVTLSLTATAQEYSNGGWGASGRGPAIVSPVDAFGLKPPSNGDADGYPCRKNDTFQPYYAPLSPTPTFTRWCPTRYVPYYCGYCPHLLFKPQPPPYGSDAGWGDAPPTGAGASDPGSLPYSYGIYTGAGRDETAFWNMGGNGLAPYGTVPATHSGPPDIVDMIQAGRSHGGACAPRPDGAVVVPLNGGFAPVAK